MLVNAIADKTKYMRKLFSLLLSALISSLAFGQIFEPVSWDFQWQHVSGDKYKLQFIAKIDKTWHLYSQHLDEGGPIPTEFTFEKKKGVKLSGSIAEIGELETNYDRNFEMDLAYFSNQVTFEQIVELKANEGLVNGYVTFMTCDDSRCLPPNDVDFSFKIKPAETAITSGDRSFEAAQELSENVVLNSEKQEDPQEELTYEQYEAMSDVVKQGETNEQINPVNKTKAEERSTSADEPIELHIEQDLSESRLESLVGEREDFSITVDEGISQPVKWQTSIKKISNSEAEFSLKAKIDDGWHIYGLDIEDGGPIATNLVFNEEKHNVGDLQILGELLEGHDSVFDMMVSKFKKEVEFVQKLRLDEDGEITGFIEFMACEEGRCLPPEEIPFKAVKVGDSWKSYIGNEAENATITAIGDGNFPDFGEPASDCIEAIDTSSLFWTFIQGLGFGLLALLTPCVFPMIPLTVSFFTKSTGTNEKKSSGVMQAVFYGFSILFIYLLVSVPFWIANIPNGFFECNFHLRSIEHYFLFNLFVLCLFIFLDIMN